MYVNSFINYLPSDLHWETIAKLLCLIQAFVSPRIDFGNAIFEELDSSLKPNLQSLLNASTVMICKHHPP